VARVLLNEITDRADGDAKPTRLVSGALNIDSFSLYLRAGFVPHTTFQDTLISVAQEGFDSTQSPTDGVRPATLDDLDAIVSLEDELVGIRRSRDWNYFIENRLECWHVSISADSSGSLNGVRLR
jgi:hypothetical protein